MSAQMLATTGNRTCAVLTACVMIWPTVIHMAKQIRRHMNSNLLKICGLVSLLTLPGCLVLSSDAPMNAVPPEEVSSFETLPIAPHEHLNLLPWL